MLRIHCFFITLILWLLYQELTITGNIVFSQTILSFYPQTNLLYSVLFIYAVKAYILCHHLIFIIWLRKPIIHSAFLQWQATWTNYFLCCYLKTFQIAFSNESSNLWTQFNCYFAFKIYFILSQFVFTSYKALHSRIFKYLNLY